MRLGRRRALHASGTALGVALLLPVPGDLHAEVVVRDEQRHYPIDGSSVAAVNRQLAEHLRDRGGSHRSHGLTESSLEASYDLVDADPVGCMLRGTRVALTVTTTLPRWTPRRSPAPHVRAQIVRMIEGLAKHEAGHRDNAIEAANALERKLFDLPAAPDCRRARQWVERIVKRAAVRLQARESNYDLATGHGRSQGALLEVVIPVGVRGAGMPRW